MQKKQQSIWTTDITPHVVNFMTMDITPDFTSEFWHQDVTHHVIGTMAIFGLVVSAFVTTVGVASVGVQTEVAFAQNASAVSQTAALAIGDTPPPSAVLLPNVTTPVSPAAAGTTTVPGRPVMDPHIGSTTLGLASSASQMFCPKISRTIGRGTHEATTTGDVGQLQQFMANHFGLDTKNVVTGNFGSTTQALVQKFQMERGIPTSTTAGPLTRAAIARLCNPSVSDPASTKGDTQRDNHVGTSTPLMNNGMGGKADDHHQMGSTSPATGSTTPPMPPMRHDDMRQPPVPPKVPTTMPVSYNNYNDSNTAAALEAVNEISDGYGKLFSAAFSLIGL